MWPCQISTNSKQHYWARPQCSSPLKIWRNFNAASQRSRFQEKLYVDERANCVKKAPTLATRSFSKHGLFFFIIFGKQHQHSFKNDMHIQPSLSVHFYLGLLYLLSNSFDRNGDFWRHSHETVPLLQQETSDFISPDVCPPNSLDLNLDFRLRGLVQEHCVHCTRHMSATSATWSSASLTHRQTHL